MNIIQGFENVSIIALIVIAAVIVLWIAWIIKEGKK